MTPRDPRLKDKWWRLTHLYKIRNKQGQLVTFKPNWVQLMILSTISSRLRARIAKYRQGGVTTLFCIDYLDDALWNPGFTAAIIAHDRETLDKIFQIIELAFDNLPKSIKPETRQDTLRMLRFQNTYDGQPLNSAIYVAMKIRGGTVQALHISERAYIEGLKSQELEAGSKQAVPLTGKITEESTGNGFNEYYDAFTDEPDPLIPESLQFLNLFYAWHEHPEYRLPGKIEQYLDYEISMKDAVRKVYKKELEDEQLIWYRFKLNELRETKTELGLSGLQLMKQEYPSTLLEAFQSGAGNVFDQVKLSDEPIIQPIRILPNGVKIFHEPQEGMFYGLGCDPSDGVADPAAIAVWDENYRKCAEWSGLKRPDDLAELVRDLADMYNYAFAGVENNMLSTILFLKDIYDNYFSTVTIDERRDKRTKKIGWTTSSKTRDVMIDDFNKHFEEDSLEINSAKTLSEMKTFVIKENGKREHAVGKHDDMLIADMIAQQMIKHKGRSKHRKRVYTHKPAGL